ncbi:uncharacterized protein LOC130810255 isoform X1 [Amaranthus tricolor]|uniref:uncharacterized protein LOC130810255 isoform X1 n=1 Tax=Amaranthus tricolor TaxID=29722 RepID=UPI00258EE909|nr:uncharacterized protein LOC130810255 isoform X1 [Amaranthus tricolor]
MDDIEIILDEVREMYKKNDYIRCLQFIENLDKNIVMSNFELFEKKLHCLWILYRVKDVVMESETYLASNCPITSDSTTSVITKLSSSGNKLLRRLETVEKTVKNMIDEEEYMKCWNYLETLDSTTVYNSIFLLDSKLNCLIKLNREKDAFLQAKSYVDAYLPLTPLCCSVLGEGYEQEENYVQAYHFVNQAAMIDIDKKKATLGRYVEEFEKRAKMIMDEENYNKCLEYLEKVDSHAVKSSFYLFETKLKCLCELDRKTDAFVEAKSYHASGLRLSSYICQTLGYGFQGENNYEAAIQFHTEAMKRCTTKKEKAIYHTLLRNLRKLNKDKRDEEIKELDECVAQITQGDNENKKTKAIKNKDVGKDDQEKIKQTDSSFIKNKKKKKKKKTEATKNNDIGRVDQEKIEHIPNEEVKSQLPGEFYEEEIEVFSEKHEKETKTGRKEEESEACSSDLTQRFSSTCQFIIGAPPQRGIFNAIKKDRFSTSNVSFIKANQKQLENLDMLKTWGFNLPYMLRVESVEAPNFMHQDDTPFLVVEQVQPLRMFFTSMRTEFLKSNQSCKAWWRSIMERFRLIFRDIMCGIYYLHSSNRVCCDFHDSFYVTKEGRGKILHNFSHDFSHVRAKNDLKELMALMEFVINDTPHPGNSKDFNKLRVLENSYELPFELIHFFMMLHKFRNAAVPST